MNLIFLAIAASLILIALALTIPPIWRSGTVRTEDMDQRNILIAKQRLAELKANWQAGGINQEHYHEQVAELEQTLLDDLSITQPVPVSSRQGRWMAYVLMLAVPLVSGSLYWALGNFQAISQSKEMSVAAGPTATDINKMVEGLAERMKSDPENAEGWLMLGRSYKYLEQYPKAVEAFGNAYRLLGDKPDVMLMYAEAIALASNKNLTGKPAELIFKSLDLDPGNMNGLWLGGLAKAQQGDTAAAITLWHKLESLLPVDSEQRKEIQNVIADLPGQTRSAASEPETPEPAKASEASITVEVSLAPEFQQAVNLGDTVFIYAQALSGPKMPLAIMRKQASELPAKVTLDDSMAMMPAMKLSNFAEVKLLARISRSGQAAAQPGDLIGTLDRIAVSGSSGNRIVIDKRVE